MGVAYLAVVFGALQGADLIFPALGLDSSAFNALVVASLIGFPVALALAWTFDVSSSGIRKTLPLAPGAEVAAPDRWARPKAALVGAAFVGVLVAGVNLWRRPDTEVGRVGVPAERPVLAVLPFEDLSPGGDQEYFADGLHEELLHQLALLRGMELRSRTSVMHFRGSGATVGIVADSLGARYVLEGTVRKAEDSVRVTVQLIDARSDEHLWSESYSRALALDALFDLQRTLATRVARSLGGTLQVGRTVSAGEPPTSSLEAYNLFLRGRHHWNQFSRTSMREAADDFEHALALDPGFGLAHAMLALVYTVENNLGIAIQGERFPLIREHAELALRYAPDQPWTQFAVAAVRYTVEWAWAEALSHQERAIALDPDFAEAYWGMAEWYGIVAGQTERALQIVEEAVRLDPFAANAASVRASILHFGRRYAEAAEAYRRLRDLDPTNPTNTMNLVSNLALAGRVQEARDLMAEALPDLRSSYGPTLAVHLARVGELEEARVVRDDAITRRAAGASIPASRLAAAEMAVGNADGALTWLERSFAEEGGIYTLRDPLWDPLRADPRFRALWERVALPGDPPA